MDQNARHLIEVGNGLFSKKASGWDALCQDIAEQFYPLRADFTSSLSLTSLGDDLMDSYPVQARETLGNAPNAMLRQGDWFAHHDVTMIAVSRATLAEIAAFKARMGWQFRWVSSHDNSFNFDFRVSFTPQEAASGAIDYNFGGWNMTGEEWPGISAFFKDEAGRVYRTYSTYGRGVEAMMGTYAMLDIAPLGRNEDEGMDWVRHHDRY